MSLMAKASLLPAWWSLIATQLSQLYIWELIYHKNFFFLQWCLLKIICTDRLSCHFKLKDITPRPGKQPTKKEKITARERVEKQVVTKCCAQHRDKNSHVSISVWILSENPTGITNRKQEIYHNQFFLKFSNRPKEMSGTFCSSPSSWKPS